MIETNGVTISSVSVTIKALKVNNRQMTQAVFNQLPKLEREEWLETCDEDGELLQEYKFVGNLWGWVNYCPKGENAELRQFVIEAGGKLYRASAPADNIGLHYPSTHDDETHKGVRMLSKHLVGLALAIVADAIREKAECNPYWAGRSKGLALGTFRPYGEIFARLNGQGVDVWNEPRRSLSENVHDEMAWNLMRSAPYSSKDPWYVSNKEPDAFMAAMEGWTVPVSRDRVQKTIDGILAHLQKMNKIRGILRDADQLFIAV